MKHKPILYYLAIATFALASGLILFVAHALFWPVDVLHQGNNGVMAVSPKSVRAGDTVEVTQVLEKVRDADVRTRRTLVCEAAVLDLTIARYARQLPIGRHTLKTDYVIPETTPSGTCRIFLYVTYDISPLRTVNYTWRSEPFEVRNEAL